MAEQEVESMMALEVKDGDKSIRFCEGQSFGAHRSADFGFGCLLTGGYLLTGLGFISHCVPAGGRCQSLSEGHSGECDR